MMRQSFGYAKLLMLFVLLLAGMGDLLSLGGCNATPSRPSLSIANLKKAAAAGDAQAMNRLGDLYYRGALFSPGYQHGMRYPAPDYHKAYIWYKKAAAAGNTDAMYHLGVLYYTGAALYAPMQNAYYPDHLQAYMWFKKAAHAGNTEAMVWLGRIYQQGCFGIPMSVKKARYWMNKAVGGGKSSR